MSHRVRLIALLLSLGSAVRWSVTTQEADPRTTLRAAARFQRPSRTINGHDENGSRSPFTAAVTVDFRHDIKPILTAHCFSCHGPGGGAGAGAESGPSGLRLDRRAAAVVAAIVPGHPGDSPLIARVTSSDSDQRMPPPGGNRVRLRPDEIALLRRWIAEGASYEPHWSFTRPARPAVPRVKSREWCRNEVDAFIAAQHEARALAPSPVADRATLLRRLSFDVVGLPPRPDDVADFVRDSRPDAYDRAVDRLLASPAFGERMAEMWLDLVRYADTDGYSMDNHREVALYRDFVIRSFNDDKSFDEFTRQQLAGDLIPRPSRDDRVGSGYNRLLMTSQEGCADPKEYVHRYAADRVRNVSAVWLGVTMGCAECHDHKFDPFTARDFYRLAALFADLQETPVGPQAVTRFGTPAEDREVERLEGEIAQRNSDLDERAKNLSITEAEWEARVGRQPTAKLPPALAKILAVDPDERTPQQKQLVTDEFRASTPELASLERSLIALRSTRDARLRLIPASLTSKSGPRRVVRILPRGNWADESGPIVLGGIPECLATSTGQLRDPTRLDLANWLASRDNPLVARVFVNRLWKIGFGRGLVATVEDFGTRGAPPSHPELLDWLAIEFMERGWDVKGLWKLILLSNTYRQSSERRADLERRDPDNLTFARQNRFRLGAEAIRDNALAVSGLLTQKLGGRSVKPYQPEGFWGARFVEKDYRQDSGPDLYRRGLYCYWCRNYLHPALEVFDAPSRSACTGDRTTSSTPQQALVLLNDVAFGEAARALAARVIREGGTETSQRLNYAMLLTQSRSIRAFEESLLSRLLEKHRQQFAADRPAAVAVASTGESKPPHNVDPVELAAWTSVAKVVLNLFDTVTRK